MPDFDRLARYYDLDYEEITTDIALYLELAKRTGSPVLEVGCGTGRILVPIAKAGFRVTGVDISAKMLDTAKQKVDAAGLSSNVTLVNVDARELALAERFALAFAATNTLMLFVDLDDQIRLLSRLHEHLQPGGLCVFDLFNPHPAQLGEATGALIHEYTKHDRFRDVEVTKFKISRVDVARQRLDVTHVYDDVAPDGTIRRSVLPFAMHYFWLREIELLLARTGFRLDHVYGAYDLDEYDAESPQLIIVCTNDSRG